MDTLRSILFWLFNLILECLFSSLSDFISTLGELRIKNVSIERYDNFVHSDMTVCFSDEKLAGIEDYGVELENVCFSYGKIRC